MPDTNDSSSSSSSKEEKKEASAGSDKHQKEKKDPKAKEMSAEDVALKERLDSLVNTIIEKKADGMFSSEPALVKNALEALRQEIKSSTGSMTALPKPLKFLRSAYDALKSHYESLSDSPNRSLLASILSVLAMTSQSDENARETLKYKLLSGSSQSDIGAWGHEYVRHLSGEVGRELKSRIESNNPDTAPYLSLVDQIVPFFLSHNAEFDATDLLIETDQITRLSSLVTKDNHDRIARYLLKCADFIPDADEQRRMHTVAYDALLKFDNLTDALRVAIKMNDKNRQSATFKATQDRLVQKQLALILGAHRIMVDDLQGDDELMELAGNVKLSQYYQQLALDLDVKDPKHPDDIYKVWLEEGGPARRGIKPPPTANTGVDSAKQNLASTFVNAFVNVGFGKDLLITPEGSEWLYKNKSHGLLSAAASLGMLMLWDVESGFSAVDRYSYSNQALIKAGAALAHGILSSSVTSEMDAAQALLSEHVDSSDVDLKISAILGLGIAYAGTAREDVLELLVPKIVEEGQTMEVVATTVLSLGLVYCGTNNDDVSGSIIEAFMACSETDLKDSTARLMCLGMGLLFLGSGDDAEGALNAIKVIEHPISKYLSITVESCAWAGSGSVLAIQKLLSVCAEHIEETAEEKDPMVGIHQEAALIGIAAVAMGEELSSEMALRSIDHLLQYGEVNIRRVVPIALALLSVSNPRLQVLDTMSKLSHDSDERVSQNAILCMGFLGAGTNNSRIATALRGCASYYSKEPNHLFLTRLAQGLLHMGKGLVTLNPLHSDSFLLNKPALAALLTVFHAACDLKNTLLSKRHYLLYTLAIGIRPRCLIILDEDLKPIPVAVRVGQKVDTVGVAGKPKAITGFQTHTSPVLIAAGERAELATDEYISLTSVLEGFVIVRKNPDYRPT